MANEFHLTFSLGIMLCKNFFISHIKAILKCDRCKVSLRMFSSSRQALSSSTNNLLRVTFEFSCTKERVHEVIFTYSHTVYLTVTLQKPLKSFYLSKWLNTLFYDLTITGTLVFSGFKRSLLRNGLNLHITRVVLIN